jgi:hypothetical protein
MNIQALLAIVIGVWVIDFIMSVIALILAIMNLPRRFGLVMTLAGIAMLVGYLGFGRWTPFPFFPQIGYTWSSGDIRISLSSSWFFMAPLVLGLGATLIALVNRKKNGRAHLTPDQTAASK